ncbi:MAG TPA: hypothetical protein VME92_08360 [Acetobacteraceae bacterium]|nr:hypothetical protein [Acetobacteraceae bacterium]
MLSFLIGAVAFLLAVLAGAALTDPRDPGAGAGHERTRVPARHRGDRTP